MKDFGLEKNKEKNRVELRPMKEFDLILRIVGRHLQIFRHKEKLIKWAAMVKRGDWRRCFFFQEY